MSLLEDIFLQDEANEAQELERIIEGDEFEGRPRSDSDDNSEKEDEAEEDKRKVDPASTKTRRVIKNPRFILNPARLTGPRGIQIIPDHFKDFKFKGKGHEKEDLDLVLKKLEHWAYRLYPKFQFEDCLKKIETLGKKRPVMVHLQKIRSDQYLSEETVVQKDSSEDEAPQDEFDKLLQQQIELARSTPANKTREFDSVEKRPLTMPKATSSPSISEEQKQRMIRNRKLAEERRLARIKNLNGDIQNTIPEGNEMSVVNGNNDNDVNVNNDNGINGNSVIFNNDNLSNVNVININNDVNTDNDIEMNVDNEIVTKPNNRSNVIDSSDEEVIVNESISVDVHKNDNNSNDSSKFNNEIKSSNTDVVFDSILGNNINKDNTEEISNNKDNEENESESLNVKETNQLQSENVDDIMDADFGDEF